MRTALLLAVLLASDLASAASWQRLFNGKNLDGWELLGDGVWTILDDGTLVGQREKKMPPFESDSITRQKYTGWTNNQSWLYTKKDYGEFDLELDYWLRTPGNSGISIRDTSRAKYGIITPPDYTRTPSKIGYEIQLNNLYPDPNPSGSIYTFAKAKTGVQRDNQWNHMRIESRNEMIRVFINGQLVAEHAGDPARAKKGPIGLQLHDQFSLVMFRNVRIREL